MSLNDSRLVSLIVLTAYLACAGYLTYTALTGYMIHVLAFTFLSWLAHLALDGLPSGNKPIHAIFDAVNAVFTFLAYTTLLAAAAVIAYQGYLIIKFLYIALTHFLGDIHEILSR